MESVSFGVSSFMPVMGSLSGVSSFMPLMGSLSGVSSFMPVMGSLLGVSSFMPVMGSLLGVSSFMPEMGSSLARLSVSIAWQSLGVGSSGRLSVDWSMALSERGALSANSIDRGIVEVNEDWTGRMFWAGAADTGVVFIANHSESCCDEGWNLCHGIWSTRPPRMSSGAVVPSESLKSDRQIIFSTSSSPSGFLLPSAIDICGAH